jgi:hypothetical protein
MLKGIILKIRRFNYQYLTFTNGQHQPKKSQVRESFEANHTQTNDKKPTNNHKQRQREACGNCYDPTCPRGKRCKTDKSVYCKVCKNKNEWHLTNHHNVWNQRHELRGKIKAKKQPTPQDDKKQEKSSDTPTPGKVSYLRSISNHATCIMVFKCSRYTTLCITYTKTSFADITTTSASELI